MKGEWGNQQHPLLCRVAPRPIRRQATHAPDALLDAIGLCRGFVRWLAWGCCGLVCWALAEQVQAPDLIDQPVPDHHLWDSFVMRPHVPPVYPLPHHPPHCCNKNGHCLVERRGCG